MFTRLAAGLLLAASAASLTQAASLSPSFTTFGTLSGPGITLGGTGIPNDAVAITTIVDGNNTITLGLTAFQRFFNPPLSNNGAGAFTARTGENYGDPATPTTPGTPSSLLGTTWGFSWYIDVAGGGTIANYDFRLLYDLDPGAGTDESAHGRLTEAALFTPGFDPGFSATRTQSAQNLRFSFWTLNAPGFIVPPAGSFDANVPGEYTLALQAYSNAGALLGQSAILVNVESVPEPASGLLLGAGLLGLVRLRHRR